jgi:polyisoprenyl-phosphate glycosyltransferase
MKKLISVIIPAYNEELVIKELARRLTLVMGKLAAYSFEVIVVDNGSGDDTVGELMKVRTFDRRFKIVQLTKNEGCDGGIIAGLTFARGDAAVVMMADLQEAPELIARFIKKWEEGYDIVYGIVKRRTGATFNRQLATYVFYQLISTLTRGMVPRDVSDFRLMDRRAYRAIVDMPEHNKFFRGLSTWIAFRRIGIPFERAARAAGVSKADFRTVWTVAINGITSFSYAPLHLPWVMSAVAMAGAVGMWIFSPHDHFLSYILILFAFLCAMMGMQNAYLIRILEEVRQRPNFVIRKTFGVSQKTVQ